MRRDPGTAVHGGDGPARANADAFIARPNPIITGWVAHYRIGVPKQAFGTSARLLSAIRACLSRLPGTGTAGSEGPGQRAAVTRRGLLLRYDPPGHRPRLVPLRQGPTTEIGASIDTWNQHPRPFRGSAA
jgi:hypothetical protein